MKHILNLLYRMDQNALPGNYWFADFEVNNLDQKVYLWGLKNAKQNDFIYDLTLESFVSHWLNIKNNCGICRKRNYQTCQHKKHIIYFQNGSGYDLKFVVRYLAKNGYMQKVQSHKNILMQIKENPWIKKYKGKKLGDKVYELIVERGRIYQMRVKVEKIDLFFKCSKILFLPKTSLKKMGELLNKSQNIYNFEKLDYDYDKYYHFKDKNEVPNQCLTYLEQDVDILKFFMLEFNRVINFQKWKLTLASTSYHFWKNMVAEKLAILAGVKFHKKLAPKASLTNPHYRYEIKKQTLTSAQLFTKQVQPHYFNPKVCDQHDLTFRTAYSGGLTHANPNKVGLFLDNLTYIDINSSYAYIMQSDFLLPYGKAIPGEKIDPKYPCQIWEIFPVYIVENKKGIPFLPELDKSGTKWYRKKLYPGSSWKMTNYEFQLFKQYYKGKYKAKLLFQFHGIPARVIFGDYINFWWAKKTKQSKDIEQYIAKIYSNSLYGKFGQRNILKNYFLNYEKLFLNWDFLAPSECKLWEYEEVLIKNKYFLPIAMFITSLARKRIIDAVGDQYQHVVYCDTDSLIYEKKFKANHIHISDKIGDWKIVYQNIQGVIRNKKNYFLLGENLKKSVIASFKIDRTLLDKENFIYGFMFHNQIQAKETKEGVKIHTIMKEMKAIWDKDHVRHPDTWFKTKKEYLKHPQAIKSKPKTNVFK